MQKPAKDNCKKCSEHSTCNYHPKEPKRILGVRIDYSISFILIITILFAAGVIWNRFTVIENTQPSQDKRIEALEENTNKIDKKLTKIEVQVSDISENVKELRMDVKQVIISQGYKIAKD